MNHKEIEALAKTLWNKHSLNYDGRVYMTKDLFTLAIQDELLSPKPKFPKPGMTKQELAIAISEINWLSVQADGSEAEKLFHGLVPELMKYSRRDIIHILLEVIEAKELTAMPDDERPECFNDMLEFKYINSDNYNQDLLPENEY